MILARKLSGVEFGASWHKRGTDGRPIWVGAAIFDKRVGPSHTTGEFTHITHADVDAERDVIFKDLEQNGELAEVIVVQGFQKVLEGRNGQNLYEGVIAAKAQ